jgi:hypothetical protein
MGSLDVVFPVKQQKSVRAFLGAFAQTTIAK